VRQAACWRLPRLPYWVPGLDKSVQTLHNMVHVLCGLFPEKITIASGCIFTDTFEYIDHKREKHQRVICR